LHAETTPAARLRWADDHSCPALGVRPDGRLLAVYSTHGQEPRFRQRVSLAPGDGSAWAEERMLELPATSRAAFPALVSLTGSERAPAETWLFFRGLGNRLMPAWARSDDAGATWTVGGLLAQLGSATPYVKYAAHGRTVHFAFSEGHRVDFNNGIFHASYRDGELCRSDGTRLGSLAEGLGARRAATEIFRANPDSVAMISDLAVDARGRPCGGYSVERDTRPRRPRPVGADHRYRYARWDGAAWRDREIAFAGTETHDAPDDDCTGLATIDPGDVNVVYVSTNADPVTGAPLVSRADGKRHWEIFRGRTGDDGVTWTWRPLTRDSTADNLRPVVPANPRGGTAPVVWLRGRMRLPKESALAVMLLVAPDAAP
jgi:hypothetical protein